MQLNLSDQMIRVIYDTLSYCVANKVFIEHSDKYGWRVNTEDALACFKDLLDARERPRSKTRQNRSSRDYEAVNTELAELAAEDQAAQAETWAQTQDRERNQ